MCTVRAVGLIVAFFLMSVLGGCSDQSPGGPDAGHGSVVGQWNLVGITSELNGETYVVPSDEIEDDPLYYEFKSDNSGIQIYQGTTRYFSWSVQGEMLTVVAMSSLSATAAPEKSTQVYSYSASSTTLTLVFYVEEKSVTYKITHTFARVSSVIALAPASGIMR